MSWLFNESPRVCIKTSAYGHVGRSEQDFTGEVAKKLVPAASAHSKQSISMHAKIVRRRVVQRRPSRQLEHRHPHHPTVLSCDNSQSQ